MPGPAEGIIIDVEIHAPIRPDEVAERQVMRIGHDEVERGVVRDFAPPRRDRRADRPHPDLGETLHPARRHREVTSPEVGALPFGRPSPSGPGAIALAPGVAVVEAAEQERAQAVAIQFAEQVLGREPVRVGDDERPCRCREDGHPCSPPSGSAEPWRRQRRKSPPRLSTFAGFAPDFSSHCHFGGRKSAFRVPSPREIRENREKLAFDDWLRHLYEIFL